METPQSFILSVFSENKIGLLNRITIIFTRRHLNIESLTASESEVPGVYRYTIVVVSTRDQVAKVAAQISKLVEVLKTFVHEEHEIIHQEIALYKLQTGTVSQQVMEKIILANHANVIALDPEYIVIEKTGQRSDTELLYRELAPHGILEFARSGMVVISKPMKELSSYLAELEALFVAQNHTGVALM